MARTPVVLLLFCVAVLGEAEPTRAQERAPFCTGTTRTVTLDTRGLAAVYCTTSPVVRGLMEGAHASAYPVFFGALPAAWSGAWLFRDRDDYTDAYRLSVTQLTTFGVVFGLKRAVGRPRPYVMWPLVSRSKRYRPPPGPGDKTSFPSGHAALSAALATSWSLSHPRWYVIAPSAAWAMSVSLSRLWLGVHYPSDVLAGAILGAGIATSVHLLRDAITPSALEPDGVGGGSGVAMTIRF